MKIRHPAIVGGLGLVGSWLIRLWLKSMNKHLVYLDGRVHPTDPKLSQHIYAYWHDSILFTSIFRTRVNVLISQHSDGEFIAKICRHLGLGTVRGSTTRSGISALLKMVRADNSHVVITPDGPRGPRRKVQPGAIFVASRTGRPIFPLGVAYQKCWEANSWDRFRIPCPFSSAFCVVGKAMHVPEKLNSGGMETYSRLLEEQINTCTDLAESWAAGKGRPQAEEEKRELRAA